MKDKIYLPTLTELLATPLLVTLLLALMNFGDIRALLLSGTQTNIANSLTQNWSVVLDKPLINKWGVLVFWMGIGLVVYSLIGMLGTVAHAYKSDVPTKDFFTMAKSSPDTVARARHEALIHMMLRSLAAGGILLWLIVNIGFLLQLFSRLFLYAIQFHDFIVGITVVIVASIDIFLLVVLCRLLLLRTRVFA